MKHIFRPKSSNRKLIEDALTCWFLLSTKYRFWTKLLILSCRVCFLYSSRTHPSNELWATVDCSESFFITRLVSSLHVGLATQFHVLNKYQFHVYWVDIQSINAFSLISCPRINNVNSNTCTKWCKTEKDRGIESYNWYLIRIVDTRSTTLYVVVMIFCYWEKVENIGS